jgi:Flp pilus assembly protein TadB
LERFRAESGMKHGAANLALLELAYRQGLPVVPLLEKILPVLESEEAHRQRSEALRRATLGQAAVASLLPWALGLVLLMFQPEIVEGFLASPVFLPVVGAALLMEAAGVAVLWKLASFH